MFAAPDAVTANQLTDLLAWDGRTVAAGKSFADDLPDDIQRGDLAEWQDSKSRLATREDPIDRLDRDQLRQLGIGGNCLPEQIIHQHGIGQFEETGQGLPLLACGAGKREAGEAFEKDV